MSDISARKKQHLNEDANYKKIILKELEPLVEKELNRHIRQSAKWYPHEYIPWEKGSNFARLGGRDWVESDTKLSSPAKSSLIIGLLTEDNLPGYHHEASSILGREGPWSEWVNLWTAEEGRHGTAIRDYLVVTRAVDPVALEEARMAHLSRGYRSIDAEENLKFLVSLVYVVFQEMATRLSHRNTGIATGDPVAESLLKRIALDENLHMIFYSNIVGGVLAIDPANTMRAINHTIREFSMPGSTIEGYGRKALEIALEGIYDIKQHRDTVIKPILKKWKIFQRNDLGPEGEKLRDELTIILKELDLRVDKFEEYKEKRKSRLLNKI